MTPSDLEKAVERYQSARPALRVALHQSAVNLAIALNHERNALVDLLEKRWTWLDANPGHPSFIEREDEVLADLKRYEQQEDALRMAANALFGRESA